MWARRLSGDGLSMHVSCILFYTSASHGCLENPGLGISDPIFLAKFTNGRLCPWSNTSNASIYSLIRASWYLSSLHHSTVYNTPQSPSEQKWCASSLLSTFFSGTTPADPNTDTRRSTLEHNHCRRWPQRHSSSNLLRSIWPCSASHRAGQGTCRGQDIHTVTPTIIPTNAHTCC